MTELYFKGKEFVYNHHLAVPHRPLVPDAGKSIGDPDLSGNLIIQGDNLHALKSLLPTHAGKVDCIFIDPPYNTGNEKWRYNDNVNAPMIRDWLAENPVGVEDGLRHDKWCAMMWPRLKLLHELLSETGSLWMTLDDNEAHRGKLLLDQIFGEGGFLGQMVWRKKAGGGQTVDAFVTEHDYMISYRKTSDFEWIDEQIPIDPDAYDHEMEDGRKYALLKLEKWGASARAEDRPTMTFPISGPNDTSYIPTAPDGFPGRWRVGRKRMSDLFDADLIEWVTDKKGKTVPHERVVFDPEKTKKIKLRSILMNSGSTGSASKLLTEIFGKKDIFDNSKPVELITKLLSHTADSGALILDSFAGSGTTAHAVLKANAEDGGDRKFILVEMEDNIADPVTAERVRRVINGYDHDGKTTAGLGGNFTFCTLGAPLDLDRILTGDDLPAYDALAPVLYHMATSRTLDPASLRPDDHYVGEAGDDHVWMIYRPDLDWLKSDAAALTLTRAKEIQGTAPDKRHLVFAPARFVSEAVLRDHDLHIAYVPFPNALYQIAREGS